MREVVGRRRDAARAVHPRERRRRNDGLAGPCLRGRVAAGRYQARRDQRRCEVTAPTVQTTVPPCPQWCMFEAGHPYKEIVEDVEQVRFHCSEDIDQWAQIVAHETMIDGAVT